MIPRRAAIAALASLAAAAPAASGAQDAPATEAPAPSASAWVAGAVDVKAPPASTELELFQLDGALAKETTVASRRARTIRETPGVVTVLSREEILASGARDLADLLLRVPGFQLGVDVESGIGLGFRGIWGHEGKVLVLVDGFEMNDLSYGTVPFGNHFLLDQVESVEIIRGPGSALYGGHAELAVVNVVTRAGSISGAAGSVGAGRMGGATAALYATGAGGTMVGDLRVGAVADLGLGSRTDRTYTDLAGGSYSMADASRADPGMVSVAATWRAGSLRFLYDDYRTTMRDAYSAVIPLCGGRGPPGCAGVEGEEVRWRTMQADARWELRLDDRITITPRVTLRRDIPWQALIVDRPETYYDVTADRATAGVVAATDPIPSTSIVAGIEGYLERAHVNDPVNEANWYRGGTANSVTYGNIAAFAEADVETVAANVLAGARIERHSAFGTSFVPRLAVTKLFAPFHVKLLATGAYRAPSIEDINFASDPLRPERAWDFEVEAGWQATPNLYVVANAFDVTILDPIVFGYATATDVYQNDARTGSRGVELEARTQLPFGSAGLGWSFYDARGKNRTQAYAVPGHPDLLAGFAGHKVVAHAELRPWKDLVVSPSLVWLSPRYAVQQATDTTVQPWVLAPPSRIGSRVLVDVFTAWRDLGLPGLEIGVGLRNLFDADMVLPQPYPGGHAPLPGASREIALRVRLER